MHFTREYFLWIVIGVVMDFIPVAGGSTCFTPNVYAVAALITVSVVYFWVVVLAAAPAEYAALLGDVEFRDAYGLDYLVAC